MFAISPLSDGVRKYYEPHIAARLVCEYECVLFLLLSHRSYVLLHDVDVCKFYCHYRNWYAADDTHHTLGRSGQAAHLRARMGHR